MDKKLIGIFEAIKNKIISSENIKQSLQNKLVGQINELTQEYRGLELTNEEHYEVLLKKGEENLRTLKKNVNKESLDQLDSYLRYARASVYDFNHDLSGLNYFTRSFLVTAILFMGLSPQFFGFMLPFVFLLPVFLGLKGIKQRSKTGLFLALSVTPVALMTGIIWARYALYAFSNFNQVLAQMVAELNRSVGLAKMVIIVPSILGFVLIGLALLTTYYGYKYRKLFV